ncbi:hypothetical protein QBC43DRAFT_86318 [Cladorrhinum sp. PSN259]|nr:hypothetical protein QBC43DRAFT_86318 [Cladorrhinum sp. PSN259]
MLRALVDRPFPPAKTRLICESLLFRSLSLRFPDIRSISPIASSSTDTNKGLWLSRFLACIASLQDKQAKAPPPTPFGPYISVWRARSLEDGWWFTVGCGSPAEEVSRKWLRPVHVALLISAGMMWVSSGLRSQVCSSRVAAFGSLTGVEITMRLGAWLLWFWYWTSHSPRHLNIDMVMETKASHNHGPFVGASCVLPPASSTQSISRSPKRLRPQTNGFPFSYYLHLPGTARTDNTCIW